MLKLTSLSYLQLENVSLDVAAGECVSLSGPSGAGKSTLLRVLADLDVHQAQVSWREQAQSALPAHQWRRCVGYLPAESAWWFDTIGEHFEGHDERHLGALGLRPQIYTANVSDVSSGERQRLALLRLLSRQPEVLLLDEPTANLDEESRARVETLIAQYRSEHQAAVVWVSHDKQQCLRVAQRHYYLDPQHRCMREESHE